MQVRVALFSVASLFLTVGALPASAMTMEQTQEVSQNGSARTSVSCDGGSCSGSAEATTSQTARQSQFMTTEAVGRVVPNRHRGTVLGVRVGANADGRVRLTWGYRGDTCHVRYTEAREKSYKYSTSANCDDGGVTIGGLTPGVKYRFQVAQGGGNWSKPVVVLAR
jgi:hypothetical protein